jgi:glycosyltransferase involved in cell wall biosynthesis
MPRTKTLIFYPALAPYNIDLFNRLSCSFDFRVVFLNDSVRYHPELNQGDLKNLLTCNYEFVRDGFTIAGRDFRTGIWSTIRRFRPEIVITVEFAFATLAVAFYKKFLSKNRFGHIILTAENPMMLKERRGMRAWLTKKCSYYADGMLVYTNAMKRAYMDMGVAGEKVFVCANHQAEAIFTGKLNAARMLADKNIKDYGLAGKKVVLYVGRLVSLKGVDRIIRAFAMVGKDIANAVLVLIGDGPEKASLEKLAKIEDISDKIIFGGHLEGDNLRAWYIVSTAFVLASGREPYGAVVNEAMLAGVPVVCSSCAGASELIREGKNGFVVDSYDISAIAKRITDLLVKTKPLSSEGAAIKENLMPVTFEDHVQEFIRAVESVVK